MSTYVQLDAATDVIERTPAAIEREIERTRDRMSNNLEELTGRLDPRRLKRRARDAIAARALDGLTVALHAIVRNPLPVTAVTLGVLSVLVRRHQRRGAARRLLRVAAGARS
jgi:hypothetical protein